MSQRSWIRLALAGVLFVLAASAFASSAAAQPLEIGECGPAPGEGKTTHGGFTNASCTKESTTKTGKYELYRGLRTPTVTMSGGKTVLESAGSSIVCSSAAGTAHASGGTGLTALELDMSGCSLGSTPCTGEETASGQIGTAPLTGVLGIAGTGKEPGALEIGVERSEPFLEAECGSNHVVVRGSALGALRVGKAAASTTVSYKSKKGTQSVTEFEGGAPVHLEMSVGGGSFHSAGLATTLKLSAAHQKMEIINGGGPPPYFGEPAFKAPGSGTFLISDDESRDDAECCGGGLVTGLPQEFVTPTSALRCEGVSGTGTTSGTYEPIVSVVVQDEKCTLYVFEGPLEGTYPFEAEPATYEYEAEGFLKLPALKFKFPPINVPPMNGCKLEIQATTAAVLYEDWPAFTSADANAPRPGERIYDNWSGNCAFALNESPNDEGYLWLPTRFEAGTAGLLQVFQ